MNTRSQEWTEVSLGDICEFKYGRSLPETARLGGSVPVFGSNGLVGLHNEAITLGPTVVIGRKGSFGEVNFSESPCWPIDTTYYVDSTATKADLRWLAYRLSALGLTTLNRAAAIPGLNRDDAYRQRLLLPPLPEQRRIAHVLDRADALRAKRRVALAQLNTLTRSIFLETARQQKGSREVCLADVAEATRGSFVNGPFGSDLLTNELQGEGVPVIYIRDIREGEYRRVSTACVSDRKAKDLGVCSVGPGDVLVAKVGDPPGVAAVYPHTEPKAIVTQDVIRIRLDTHVAVPEFIVSYLNSSLGRWKLAAITIEATRARFSLGNLKKLKVELPPLSVQLEFARNIARVQALRSTQRASLTALESLFASLRHVVFQGDLWESTRSAETQCTQGAVCDNSSH